jgi:hypothetical protein
MIWLKKKYSTKIFCDFRNVLFFKKSKCLVFSGVIYSIKKHVDTIKNIVKKANFVYWIYDNL